MIAVIFDMDGVIIDSEPFYEQQMRNFFDKHNVYAPKEITDKFIGASHGYWDKIQEVNPNLNIIELKNIFDGNDTTLQFNFKNILNQGIVDLLSKLKSSNYKIGLASSSPMVTIKTVLTKCDIIQYFDVILSGSDLKEGKPHPEIFISVAKILDIEASKCVVIEDSYNGVLAAKRAGMKIIGLVDKRYNMDINLADVKVTSITEIDIELINNLVLKK